ncbi:cyclase family protein [Neomegalonema perideroedes]|uniref:cyclase family protein n=1 Tax=Neomegalonema perideroedes TaxID=217219 RepID=UPI000365EFCE|nr:cyclase family protein [Neomegalonema perideroedes]
MCHACVMDSVQRQLLDRRRLLKAAAGFGLGGAAFAAGIPAPARAQPAATGRVVDLTHTLFPDFPAFDEGPQFALEKKFDLAKDGYNLHIIRVNEHVGTHLDAPLHFSADGISVAEIPVERLVAPLAVLDLRARAAEDPDAQVTPDDVKAWIAEYGELPAGACVALLSGWDSRVAEGTFKNLDAEGRMRFPGFHPEAVAYLLEETEAGGIAVDTLSLDHGLSPDFATHRDWLGAGRWGLECAANLAELPASGATIVVGAPKFQGGTGGPTRAIALI